MRNIGHAISRMNRPRIPQDWEGEGKWPRRGSGVCRFCGRATYAYIHIHALANEGDEAAVVVRSARNQSLVRALTLEVETERDGERERENRIGRRERAELRSAELPFLRTCLAASSSSPTDYGRLLLSLCAHLVRPQTYTLSFLFFFSVLGSTFIYYNIQLIALSPNSDTNLRKVNLNILSENSLLA